jgi:dolichol-phosphate mannosyltransferase
MTEQLSELCQARDAVHHALASNADASHLFKAWLRDLQQREGRTVADLAALIGVKEDHVRLWLQEGTDDGLETAVAPPLLSIVLPVYNEYGNIDELYQRLSKVLEETEHYELLFVDDGSIDDSAKRILELQDTDQRIVLLRFSRNFGHQAAMSAGLEASRGRAVVMMDADLQDPPEVLPELIARRQAGYEVVYAVRHKRKEGFLKRGAYFLFYRALRAVSDFEMPVDSGDFCLLDRKIVDHLNSLPERNRFLRGLRTWVGYRQTAVHYERSARFCGKPKYTFRKLVKLAFDGVLSFSAFPLRIASYAGLLACTAALVCSLYVLGWRLAGGEAPQGWASTIIITLFLGGVQLTVLGILGEYVARIFDETKGRPNYIVADIIRQRTSQLPQAASKSPVESGAAELIDERPTDETVAQPPHPS